MAALFYCSDADLTDQLPGDLSDSPIDTSAKRDVKCRGPARDWVDSMYPNVAPFAQVGGQSVDWLVNQTDHAAGDTTVIIDSGTGDPVVGDEFRIEGQNTFYKIQGFAANVVTYNSRHRDFDAWDGAAFANFPDNARLYLGTPGILRTAATHYATALGILLLKRNPEDKMAAAMFEIADKTLGASRGGVATRAPWPYTEWAEDAQLTPPIFTAGESQLSR